MSSTTNHNDNNNGGSGKGWRALHSPENRPPNEESNGSSSSSSPSCNHNAFIRAIHAMSSSYFNGELRQAMAGAKEETKAFIRREFAAEREKVISVLDDAWQRFSLAVVNEQVELAFAKMTAQMEAANEDIFRRALATDGVGSAFLRELTQAATCEVVLTQTQAQAEAEAGVKNLERAQQLYHLRARTFDKARARAEEAAAAQQRKRKAEEMEQEEQEEDEDDIRSIPGTPPPPRQPPPPLILSLPPTTSLKALEQLPASKSNRPSSNEEQRGGIFPFSLSSADPLLPSTSFLAFKSATSTGGGGGGATKTASTTTTTKKPRTKKLTTLEDVAEALEAMEASSSSSSPSSVPVVKGQLNNNKKLAVEPKQQQKPLPPLFKAENSSSSNSSSVQSVPVVPKISASASSSSASLFQASTVVVSPSPSIGQVYQVLHPHHHPPHRPRTPRPPKVHRTLLMACAQPSCGRLLPPGLELTTHQLAAHGLGPYVCYAPHCLLGGDVRVSFDQP